MVKNRERRKSFLGYKRENRRAGNRNHVRSRQVSDLSKACTEDVANNIQSTIELPAS